MIGLIAARTILRTTSDADGRNHCSNKSIPSTFQFLILNEGSNKCFYATAISKAKIWTQSRMLQIPARGNRELSCRCSRVLVFQWRYSDKLSSSLTVNYYAPALPRHLVNLNRTNQRLATALFRLWMHGWTGNKVYPLRRRYSGTEPRKVQHYAKQTPADVTEISGVVESARCFIRGRSRRNKFVTKLAPLSSGWN